MNKQQLKFIQGNEVCAEAALYAGLEFFCWIPHNSFIRDFRIHGQKASSNRWKFCADGRRDSFHVFNNWGVFNWKKSQ